MLGFSTPWGVEIDYIPIMRENPGIPLATGQVAEEILEKFDRRSKEILQGRLY